MLNVCLLNNVESTFNYKTTDQNCVRRNHVINVSTCFQPHFQRFNNVMCSLLAKRVLKFFFFIILVKNEICPPFCPDIYKPVCGSNNVTYPNLCRLRFADCEFENDEKITLKHEGTCERKGIKIVCPYLQKKDFLSGC